MDNRMRAEYGAAAAIAGDPDMEGGSSSVVDTLANMLHWCERQGIDFDDCLRIAREHHGVEVLEEEQRANHDGDDFAAYQSERSDESEVDDG